MNLRGCGFQDQTFEVPCTDLPSVRSRNVQRQWKRVMLLGLMLTMVGDTDDSHSNQ